MSAFLGPIHFWLYGKIRLQEDLIRKIVECGEEKHWPEFSDGELRQQYVSTELRPLDQLIDERNIHGWLQERIHDAESRYAGLVTSLVQADPKHLPELEAIAFDFGREHAIPKTADSQGAYRIFDDSLLNGMPCDHVSVITKQDDDGFAWQLTEDIHGQYWTARGGAPEHYYLLRQQLMEGMLSSTALTLRVHDFQYEITKKE